MYCVEYSILGHNIRKTRLHIQIYECVDILLVC